MKNQSIAEYYQEQLNNPGTPSGGEIATRELSTFFSVMGNLPNPDPILKKAGKDITVYENLEYDDQVGMCIEALELSIQAMPWEIENNGASDAWVEELNAMMEDWDHERIFSEAVAARLYGFKPIEAIWKTGSKLWTIQDLVGKPAEWFRYDGKNRLRLLSKENRMEGILADHEHMPYKFIVPRHKASYKNPYGKAALSLCFWPVAFKKGGLKFWLKRIEKYGIPYLIGKQPRGSSDDETDKLLDALTNMVQDAVGVISNDSSVDILQAGSDGGQGGAFGPFVKYQDGSIAKAIIGQTLTSSSGEDGSGSYALGNVHMEVFDNIKFGTAKHVKFVYDQAFKWLTDINKGGPVPKLKFIADEDVQKERAERDEKLKKTGVHFTKTYYKNRYNLDDDEFELTEEQNPKEPAKFSDEYPNDGAISKLRSCPCGCNGEPAVHFENTVATSFPDQDAMDKGFADSPGRKRELQNQGEQTLAPIIDLINESDSFEEVFEKLASLYPELDAERLEERLSKALFVSEVFGRLSAADETDNSDGD